jgi:glycine hydroxymethyltransferase
VSEELIREVEATVRANDEWRLRKTINLIASENVLSARARALLGSDFGHRYAEGHPGARYYQGTGPIDGVEARTKEAFKRIFGCRNAEVRTISGTNANDVVFCSLVKGEDKAVVNSLTVGGHISHQLMGGLGKYTRNILPWPRSERNEYEIDAARSKDLLLKERPKAVFFGKSMILFPEPVKELAPVCRELGITAVFDGAHVLGLIAGKQFQDPLAEGCDILLGSTHKTFFGPQRGVVLSNLEDERWTRIDKVAFPGSLSNHHLFTLPPLLMATVEMLEFGRDYARQVVANAKHFAKSLAKAGFDVACPDRGYTESHQVVVDVSTHGGGGKVSVLMEQNDIICNRNLLPRDPPKKVNNPSGIRLGVQEMTRMGMKEPEMEEIARLMKACIADGKAVKDEVNRFRGRFVQVQYSFDAPAPGNGSPAALPVEPDMAGY